MLEVRRLSKQFAGSLAVDDISFSARAGEVTAYLGANGSGKSTTFKIIVGLLQPTAGTVCFDGVPVDADLVGWKHRLGYVPEEPNLYTHLSGLEYLTMVGGLRCLSPHVRDTRIEGLLHLLGLSEARDVPLAAYSKGMRQKVLLAAAVLHNPDVLLLDEPFSGLDVTSTLVLRGVIQELAVRGKCVLFSSHELATVEQISSRVVIIHRGRIVADDEVSALRTLMAVPTLEQIFAGLTVEHDPAAVSREIVDVIAR